MNQQQLIEQKAKEVAKIENVQCRYLAAHYFIMGASWMQGEGERLREELDTELIGATNDIDLIRVRLASGSSKDYLDIKLYELTMRLFKCLDKLSKPQTEHE